MLAGIIRITLTVLAVFTLQYLQAQQTSTDTTWKLKYLQEQKAKTATPPPAWPKTLTVAQDGSGDYKSIQGAINAVRDLSQEKVTIYIKKGVYNEKVVVPSWNIKAKVQVQTQMEELSGQNNLVLMKLRSTH